MKNWTVLKLNKERAKEIAEAYSLPILIAMLLDIRGITDEEKIVEFLTDDNELSDPFLMADAEKAVKRIYSALNSGEKICIYGDYDADGVTSTALLYSYLSSVGADVMYYIPAREGEGYGLNIPAIDKIHSYGVTLIITVDNGVSAVNEIDYANSLGIDTVVTDHHKPPEKLPDAAAVVDPHRKDCTSPFKELSGVGVVFKLIMALEDDNLDMDLLMEKYSDIAAIGTIGDVVSLSGENRIIVKNGIKNIEKTHRTGINELLEQSGVKGNKISAGRVSFTLVPRINACGRLGFSEKSVKLLLTDDKEEAAAISRELCEDNSSRRSIEREILASIKKFIEDNPRIAAQRIMVISGEDWHPGVIGIVAARIKEIYGKPVIIISVNGDSAKASGRSVKGFSLIDAVESCGDLLEHYGGHPMAAGLSLKSKNIDEFAARINAYAKAAGEMPLPLLEIDCKLNPASLSVEMAEELSLLEPYGAGNPTPLFGLYNMTLRDIKPIGGGNHLRLTFSRGETTVSALLFGTKREEFPYICGDILDLAVTIDINEYNTIRSLSIIIRDIKLSSLKTDTALKSMRNYDKLILGEAITNEEQFDLAPSREDFAYVFRFLKQQKGWRYSRSVLYARIERQNISCGKMMVVLTAMDQLGIIEMKENSGILYIKMMPVCGKADINAAPIIKQLR